MANLLAAVPTGSAVDPCCCGCFLTMPTQLIDSTTSPYANIGTATAALAAQAPTGCLMEGLDPAAASGTRGTFSSGFSGGILSLTSTLSYPSFANDAITERVYLTAAGGISIDYNITGSGGSPLVIVSLAQVILYEDDESTVVDSVSTSPMTPPLSFVGTFTPTVPADGYYRIYASVLYVPTPDAASTSSIILSCTGASMNPCPVRAAYGATPDYVVCS